MPGDTSKGGRTSGGARGQPPSYKRPPPPSTTAIDRKSRWESSSSSSKPAPNKPNNTTSKPSPSTKQHPTPTKLNPSPAQSNPGPRPPHPHEPLPPPIYGFHMLDRRTIVLADGSVRTYFALPPDYPDFFPVPPRLGPMSPDAAHPMKRKFGFGDPDERDDYARQKQQLLQYGNAGAGPGTSSPFRRDREDEVRAAKLIRLGNGGAGAFDGVNMMRHHHHPQQDVKVDPAVMKKFLHFVKVINENVNEKRNYLDNGKHGPLKCLACTTRSSKDFPDVHSLVMHSYNSDNMDSRVDHLALHRALCVLMGWSYMRPPDNSWAYQLLPADEAAAYQDDLIMWPPMVIIHNTNTGKSKDGRMEGLGNKAMDSKLRDIGFSAGKSKSLYNRDGHLGITLIKFGADQSGLKDAMRLADHFQKERHGRRYWAHLQSMGVRWDDENNPNLVMVDERTGERRRILYGYLLTASDLDKIDFETRKKAVIESKQEKLQPSR